MSDELTTEHIEQPRKATLRQRIREVVDGKQDTVLVPEWADITEDGQPPRFVVKSMNGKERAGYLKAAVDDEGNPNFEAIYPQLLIATTYEAVEKPVDPDDPANSEVYYEAGDKVFRSGDEDWLNDKNAAAVERIAKVAMKLSGMDGKAADEAGKASS